MPYILNEPFSLNTLHKRAGGSNETTCSLNDSDIRALRQTGSSESGSTSSFEQFAVSAVYTFTVTAVAGGSGNVTIGYLDDGSTTIGSISPDPAIVENIYSAWQIDTLAKLDGLSAEPLYLRMDKYTNGGDNAANSGWEHITIGTTSFFRAEADTYDEPNSAVNMVWQWNLDPTNHVSTLGENPFNMSGTTTVKIA
jgi:hypothetical protein